MQGPSASRMGIMGLSQVTSQRFTAQRGGLAIAAWVCLIVLVYLLVGYLRSAAPATGADAASSRFSIHPVMPGPATPVLIDIAAASTETDGNLANSPGHAGVTGLPTTPLDPKLSLYGTMQSLISATTPAASTATAGATDSAASAPAVPSSAFYSSLVARSGANPPAQGQSPAAAASAASAAAPSAAAAASLSRPLSAVSAASAHARALSSAKTRLCSRWWAPHRDAALTLIQQTLGDVVNLILDLNFEFTSQRAAYVAQLEHWRTSRFARRAEARARNLDCRAVCAPSRAPSVATKPAAAKASTPVVAEVQTPEDLARTNAFRQALIECILCETAAIDLNSRCDAKDMGADSGAPAQAAHLEAAFEGMLEPRHLGPRGSKGGQSTEAGAGGSEPFFINSPLEQTFGTFMTLLSTFAYAPAQLEGFFPLPSHQVEVSVPRARAYTRWLAQRQHDAFANVTLSSNTLYSNMNGNGAHGKGRGAAAKPSFAEVPVVETLANGGLGGGMGVQLLCRPAPDAAPVVILSAGGGGGRGFGLSLDTELDLAASADADADADASANADADAAEADGNGNGKKQRQRKRLSHEVSAARGAIRQGSLHSLPFRATRQATFSAGSGGGLQLNARPFARKRADGDSNSNGDSETNPELQAWLEPSVDVSGAADWDLIAGGGGGGSVSIADDQFTEAHGSQPDQDTHLPFLYPAADADAPVGTTGGGAKRAGVVRLRKRLYGALRDCLLHGPDAELVISGGGGAGSGAQLSALVIDPTQSNATDSASGVGASSSASASAAKSRQLASAYFGAELGFGFSLPVPHAWFTAHPVRSVRAASVHNADSSKSGSGSGSGSGSSASASAQSKSAPSVEDELLAAMTATPSRGGALPANPTTGALSRLALSRFTPMTEDPYALSAVASVCVASCVATATAATASSGATSNGSAGLAGSGVASESAPTVGSELPDVMSTGTEHTKPLFYAHCVCPCLQRHLKAKPWAGYLACRDMALGTFDRATSGHVDSVPDNDVARAERALAAAATGASEAALAAAAGQVYGADGANAGRIRNQAWAAERQGAWGPLEATSNGQAPTTGYDTHV